MKRCPRIDAPIVRTETLFIDVQIGGAGTESAVTQWNACASHQVFIATGHHVLGETSPQEGDYSALAVVAADTRPSDFDKTRDQWHQLLEIEFRFRIKSATLS